MLVLGYLGMFLVGLVLGLLGGGGSILSVPLLVYFFGMVASKATAYSLFLVGTSSLVGSSRYWRSGHVDFKTGVFFLVPSMVGIAAARRIVLPSLPDIVFQTAHFVLTKDKLILLVFSAVMLAAAYSMLRSKRQPASESAAVRPGPMALYGVAAGLLMGFVGAGGGFLIIPVLVHLGRMEMKPAIGTSLFIISINTLFGFLSDVLAGFSVDWLWLAALTLVSFAGVGVGTSLGKRVSSAKLKQGFGWMVLVIAALILAKELAL